MKWLKIKPKEGRLRIIRKFAFFPIKFKIDEYQSRIVWLENYYILQVFLYKYDYEKKEPFWRDEKYFFWPKDTDYDQLIRMLNSKDQNDRNLAHRLIENNNLNKL